MTKNNFLVVFFLLFCTSISIFPIISKPKNRKYLFKKNKPLLKYQFFITTKKKSRKWIALKWFFVFGIIGLTSTLLLKKINKNKDDYLIHQERILKKYDLETQAFNQILESAERERVALSEQLERQELLLRCKIEMLDAARQQDIARLLSVQNKLSQELVKNLESSARDKINLEMDLDKQELVAQKLVQLLRYKMKIINSARQKLADEQFNSSKESNSNLELVGRERVELEMELEYQGIILESLIQRLMITQEEQVRLGKKLISQTLRTHEKQEELILKFNITQKKIAVFYDEFLILNESINNLRGLHSVFNLWKQDSNVTTNHHEEKDLQNCLKPGEPHFAINSSQYGY